MYIQFVTWEKFKIRMFVCCPIFLSYLFDRRKPILFSQFFSFVFQVNRTFHEKLLGCYLMLLWFLTIFLKVFNNSFTFVTIFDLFKQFWRNLFLIRIWFWQFFKNIFNFNHNSGGVSNPLIFLKTPSLAPPLWREPFQSPLFGLWKFCLPPPPSEGPNYDSV